ncbi:hypothetical protein [Paludibaculum fermentans]|uniref:hypothetical protein n=1 Tax=Paludibaculum fermentans TaxID=1473598 RepID=UPI003EBDF877
MKSQFRQTDPGDGPAVAAFLQRIFELDPGSPLTAPRHLHWKCWEEYPGWTGSRGFVMAREDGIVAHASAVALSLVNAHQRLRTVHLIDWAADPGSVGSGVTLLKRIAQMVDAVLVVGGSEMTQKVLPALGFKTLGEVTRFARPIRPLRRLAGQKAGLRAGAQFARALLWSLQAPSIRTQGWGAQRIAPEQLESAAVRWPRPGEGISLFERNAKTAAYFLKCPAAPMELYSVTKDGSSRGYFMLAYTPSQARIVDFYIDGEEGGEAWRILLQLAITQASRNPSIAEVVSMGSDPVTSQALTDCGFHARGQSTLRLLPGKGVELPAAPIRFQMIDSDAAYLHADQRSYWA